MPNALRLILFTLLFLAGQLDLCASLPKTRIGNFFPLAAEPRPEIALQVPELRLDNPLLYDESASGRLFWSKFDPEGLDAWSLTKAVVGAVVGTAADGAAFVGISLVNCAGPAKASYNPVDAHFNYQDNLWKELGFKTNPIRGTPAESKQLARAAEDGMFALHGTGFFRA